MTVNEWEPAIQEFERQDRQSPPPDDPLLFTGSSSIARWSNLAEDVGHPPVLNRGFGGSEITDLIHFADRIIIPYAPRGVIIYSGDNDLAAGKRPERIENDARELIRQIHQSLPGTPLTFLSVKYSPARQGLWGEIKTLNDRFANLSVEREKAYYLDVASCLRNSDQSARRHCYVDDDLHLSEEGYALWANILTSDLDERHDRFHNHG